MTSRSFGKPSQWLKSITLMATYLTLRICAVWDAAGKHLLVAAADLTCVLGQEDHGVTAVLHRDAELPHVVARLADVIDRVELGPAIEVAEVARRDGRQHPAFVTYGFMLSS